MSTFIKKIPPISSLSAVFGGAALTSFFTSYAPDILTYPLFVTALASPFISPALAVPATINLFKKSRSSLSKVFSAAAAVAGIGGLAAMTSIQGPDGLAAPLLSTLGMTIAGALNVVSNLTSDVKVNIDVSVDPLGPRPAKPPQQSSPQ